MLLPTLDPATPIKTVTFDWGDTLSVSRTMPYAANQNRALGQFRDELIALGAKPAENFVDACKADLAEAWRASIDLNANPDHREMDHAALFVRWVQQSAGENLDRNAIRLVVERCEDELVDIQMAFAESRPVLAELKRRGYRIGIISHITWPGPACRRWFVRNRLAEFVDFYSLSSEVGYHKPSTRQFQQALDQAACQPHELLHVGDSVYADVAGGKAMGIRTCLRLTDSVTDQQIATCGADWIILRLTELLAGLPGPKGGVGPRREITAKCASPI